MITKEAILHIPKSNYSYGYDSETLHLRIRTKKGEINKVTLRIGDPYIWEEGGADGGNLNAAEASGWVSGEDVKMTKEVETELFDYWFVSYKPPMKRSRYSFILETDSEKILVGEKRMESLNDESDNWKLFDMANFYCFPYLNNIDVAVIPPWVKNTVWYQIFPDRFNNGDKSIDPVNVESWGSKPTNHNFMGGDLQGVIDKLDYLKDLGITGIYFCPIFEAKTNHRYDTVDYLKIDPALGDEKTLKKLIKEAHKRDIKIMLDAVFNHIGFFSKEWQDVVKNNEKSKYKDWFYIKKFPVADRSVSELDGNNLNYETFGRVAHMPKVNTENPEVIKHFMEVARYWIEEFNIDAWRIDVANEVDHRFWRKFRDTIKDINSEVYILGEIWHDAYPWLQGDQFDAAMNYPLTEAMIKYFVSKDLDKESFIYAVNQIKVSYPLQVIENTFNLLDSHDTSRLLSIAKGSKKRVKLAYLFMLTQLGTPCIYYGSEIALDGVKGMGKENHRSCMPWDKKNHDLEFYDFMRKLIQIRKDNKEFSTLDNKWININDNILCYQKGAITVLMNLSSKKDKFTLPEYLNSKKIIDLFKNDEIKLNDKLSLNGLSFIVMKM